MPCHIEDQGPALPKKPCIYLSLEAMERGDFPKEETIFRGGNRSSEVNEKCRGNTQMACWRADRKRILPKIN